MNLLSWMWVSGAVAVLCSATVGNHFVHAQMVAAVSRPEAKERARLVLSHALPTLDGRLLKAFVLEVNYGPGESSLPHSHPCAVIGYVVDGSIRTQVKGKPEVVVKAGESFYEEPDGVHLVSANASQTKSAEFLAYLVCDHDMPLSREVPTPTKPVGK